MSNLSREEIISHLKDIVASHFDPENFSAPLSYEEAKRIIKLLQPDITKEQDEQKVAGWKKIADEYFNSPNVMGHFYHLLCQAIQIADLENTARLREGFPELVAYIKGEVNFE